jgi:hypothetical protein
MWRAVPEVLLWFSTPLPTVLLKSSGEFPSQIEEFPSQIAKSLLLLLPSRHNPIK